MAGCLGFFIFTQCGERPARYGLSLCLETKAFQTEQAGMPEKVGANLALFEVGKEDAVHASHEQPGQVGLPHAQGRLRMSSPSATRMSKA